MNKLKRFFGFIVFNILLSNTILTNAIIASKQKPHLEIYDSVVKSYGITKEETETEDAKINLTSKEALSPTEMITIISPHLKVTNKDFKIPYTATSSMLDTCKEMDLFYGQGKESQKTYLNIVQRANTISGQMAFANILFQPIDNIEKIENRQKLIKLLTENEELFTKIDNLLLNVAKQESKIISFFKEENELTKKEIQKSFFNWYGFRFLNKSELALEGSYHASNLLKIGHSLYFLRNFSRHAYFSYVFNKCKNGHAVELPINTKKLYLQTLCQKKINTIKGILKVMMFENYTSIYKLFFKGESLDNYKKNFQKGINTIKKTLAELTTEKEKIISYSDETINNIYKYESEDYWTNNSNKVKKNLIESTLLGSLNGAAASYLGYMAYTNYKSQKESLQYMQKKLTGISTLVESIKKIDELAKTNPEIKDALFTFENIINFFKTQTPSAKQLIKGIQTNTFKGKYSYFSRLGRISANYKRMEKNKHIFTEIIQTIGELDALLSIAKLYKEFKKHKNVNYCFVEFVDQKSPYIYLQDFWNPFVNPDTVVKNTIELGKNNNSRNMILTGSNTGGKSTILKGIMLNLIMSRFGIVPAKKAIMTPFTYLASSMNISDDTAAGISLFKAETLRAKKIIEDLKSLSEDQKAFVIIDELFVGTGPEKGSKAALKFINYLGSFNNTISAFSTHFPIVTTLENKENSTFKNYKVDVYKDANGKIIRPFKIIPGISTVNIANDLLQEEIDTIDFIES